MNTILKRTIIFVMTLAAIAGAAYIGVTFSSLNGKTAAAYDAAYQTSYNSSEQKGYQSGYNDRYSIGYDQGYSQGLKDGNQKGYEAGHQKGYAEGDKQGYSDGNTQGYSDGFSAGLVYGKQAGYAAGAAKGTADGTRDGQAGTVQLHDPTYQEMLDFLASDKTNYHPYDINNFNCTDFSATVVNNAEAKGIQAAFVIITFASGGADHTLVAFNTTDRGLIYIEPQMDYPVNLGIGSPYHSSIVVPSGYYVPYPGYDDTVTSITVIW